MTEQRRITKSMANIVMLGNCIVFAIAISGINSWPSINRGSFHSIQKDVGDNKIKLTEEQTLKFDYYEKCVVAVPSKIDIQKLCSHHECAMIHCIISCALPMCYTSSKTTCHTKVCAKFTVHSLKSNIVHENINIRQLSGIVQDNLPQIEHTKSVVVKCSDDSSPLYDSELKIEIAKDASNSCDSCLLSGVVNSSPTEIKELNHTSPNVYVIYFRLMSKWESYMKLPRLNVFIEHKRSDKAWDVNTFNNVQSQSFGLDNNLRSVLNFADSSSYKNVTDNNDVIQLAIQKGYCVLFNVLACHKSMIYTEIQREVLTENNTRNCHTYKSEQPNSALLSDYTNFTFCNNNKENMDVDDALNINDRLSQIFSKSTSKILSISMINIPDILSTNVFDTAITGLVAQIVNHKSNVLVLMSDVGNPKFARFDETIFLRTHTFNPLLHVFISRRIKNVSPKLSQCLSNMKLMDEQSPVVVIAVVQNLIKTLMLLGDVDNQTENRKQTDQRNHNDNDGNIGVQKKYTESCLVENINDSVECLCQGKHARFPNDSIQVAFASYIVGNINNKLLELSSLRDSRLDRIYSRESRRDNAFFKDGFICDRLLGVSFQNIQHVLWNVSTYILMKLHLSPTSRRFSPVIEVNAEVEYSIDDNYTTNFTVNILHPRKIALTNLYSWENKHLNRLHHLLCHRPNKLAVVSTSHKEFLNYLASENHFGIKSKMESLHHPCLFLVTRSYIDSAVIEATNACTDRLYNLSVSAKFINVLSLSHLPVDVLIGPQETRYITTLVKNSYSVSKSVYKIETSYMLKVI